jgi:predicted PurR-regulated permease PerM
MQPRGVVGELMATSPVAAVETARPIARDGAAFAAQQRVATGVTPASSDRVAVVGLFVLAVLYTLYVARVVLLPIVLAVLFTFLLRPVVRRLRRLGVPEWLGALLVLSAIAISAAWAGYQLSGPATAWLQTAPQAFSRIEQRIHVLKERMLDVQQATDQVEKLTTVGEEPPVVAVQNAGLATTLVTSTWNLAAAVGMVLILTYALLASGGVFFRKLLSVVPRFEGERVADMVSDIEDCISMYLLTVSLINLGLGIAIGLTMAALGMPNPTLWGALAAVLNFIPYLGPAMGIAVVGAVSLMSFPHLDHAVLAPAAYLVIATIEGQMMTPLIHSHRFTLNPVVVLLALIFWGWIWGIPGVLLAIPLLVIMRIMCEYIPSLQVAGKFLGR